MNILSRPRAKPNIEPPDPTLRIFLRNSYKDKSKQRANIGDYVRDDSLSGNRAQVYYNPNTNKAVVVHTGTHSKSDWITDMHYAVGNLENTKRYKHADKIQNEAYGKYGKENISTVGHSLGAQLAEKVGKDSSQIYTLNRPVTPFEALNKKLGSNHTDIRSDNDFVSVISPFQRMKNNQVVIESRSLNPLVEHKTAILNRGYDVSF